MEAFEVRSHNQTSLLHNSRYVNPTCPASLKIFTKSAKDDLLLFCPASIDFLLFHRLQDFNDAFRIVDNVDAGEDLAILSPAYFAYNFVILLISI